MISLSLILIRILARICSIGHFKGLCFDSLGNRKEVTYAVVAELSNHVLLLLLPNVDHIVAGVDSVTIVIEGHLTRFAGDITAFEVLKQSLACRMFRG